MKEKLEQPAPMPIPAARIRAEVLRRLTELADEPYREFQKGLVPGNDTIIGVRVPKVRALAKEIAKKSLALPGKDENSLVSWPQYLEACLGCSGSSSVRTNTSYGSLPSVSSSTGVGCPDSRVSGGISYEERMLLGFVICYAKMDFEERLSYVSRFVPLIDNWAVCDTFCGSLKPAPENLPILWEFLQPYLALGTAGAALTAPEPTSASNPAANPAVPASESSAMESAPALIAPDTISALTESEPASSLNSNSAASASYPDTEYPIRFAVVTLLSYYIKEEYIDRVLKLLDSIRHDGYYVRMAAAWAVSMCFVRFPDQTEALLRNNHMDDFTHNKSIQKIIESLQVDKETKAMLRELKRKQPR